MKARRNGKWSPAANHRHRTAHSATPASQPAPARSRRRFPAAPASSTQKLLTSSADASQSSHADRWHSRWQLHRHGAVLLQLSPQIVTRVVARSRTSSPASVDAVARRHSTVPSDAPSCWHPQASTTSEPCKSGGSVQVWSSSHILTTPS